MNNEEKNKFDSLEVLRQSTWNSFHHRQAFEWKVCIALWTALSSFIGMFLSGKCGRIENLTATITTIVCLFIIGLYLHWINGLSRAHDIDKTIAIQFRNEMMNIVGQEFSTDLKEKLVKVRKSGQSLLIGHIHYKLVLHLF